MLERKKDILTFWHKTISISQIVGGSLGLAMIPLLLMRPLQVALPVGFYIYSPAIFGTAIVAGILLWRRSVIGYRLTLTIQTLQILQITSVFFTYNVTIGLQLLLVFGGSYFKLSPGFNIGSWIGQFPTEVPAFFAINAFSVFAVAYLLLTRRILFPLSKMHDYTGLI